MKYVKRTLDCTLFAAVINNLEKINLQHSPRQIAKIEMILHKMWASDLPNNKLDRMVLWGFAERVPANARIWTTNKTEILVNSTV